ncbi:unnamed protein product [Hermetia illucens]|uniref:Uncharacterized protein n=1 Tax=Hermetia illucens TaxID=343691 RepID=A0A7R8V1C1_HERIL|nr:unnamed protein product [Hermetia illucens]
MLRVLLGLIVPVFVDNFLKRHRIFEIQRTESQQESRGEFFRKCLRIVNITYTPMQRDCSAVLATVPN